MNPVHPLAIVLMGVSGSGKSTIAAGVAELLHVDVIEGDSYHSAANVEKMHAGIPLTDSDRLPWLQSLAAALQSELDQGRSCVLACSALKRRYREILKGGRGGVVLVYLKGSRELIAARMKARTGHFMPPELLASQFATLQEPEADEQAIIVPIDGSPEEIVALVVAGLKERGLVE